MKPRPAISALAMSDLDDCCAWIAHDSTDAAERLRDALLATLESICEHPEARPRWQAGGDRLEGLRWSRVKGFHNHLIFYTSSRELVLVVRVIHGGRDLPGVFGTA